MMEPSLDLQKGIYAALTDAEAVSALVIDGPARPDDFPCVIIGEAQTVLEAVTYTRKHARVYMSVHIWTKESGLFQAKQIAGAVADALGTPPALTDHGLIDFFVAGTRFMRDPAGEYGHAIISVQALIEVAA